MVTIQHIKCSYPPVDGIVDGSAVNVEANTTDRNGQAVTPATDSIAAQGDNDNDPSTPEDTGLDLLMVQSPLILLRQV
jgi:hypothetical protein